jgi:hypothetical protein
VGALDSYDNTIWIFAAVIVDKKIPAFNNLFIYYNSYLGPAYSGYNIASFLLQLG